MTLCELTDFFKESGKFSGNAKKSESLSSKTTIKIGGKTPLFLEPDSIESLIFAAEILKENRSPFFVLGGGSNVVFPDSPDFAVISARKLSEVSILKNESGAILKAQSGASWGKILGECRKNNLTGFEPFSALPGTVGGALFMNASCFGLSACDRLISAIYFDIKSKKITEYTKNPLDWGYKKSPFQNGGKIILEAQFFLEHFFGNQTELAEKCAKIARERAEKGHFRFPSAGSAFKNDAKNGIIAGKIIDECGLKGLCEGGAKIADFHGNIIINTGNATAKNVKTLAEKAKSIVREKTGIELKEEIIFAEKMLF